MDVFSINVKRRNVQIILPPYFVKFDFWKSWCFVHLQQKKREHFAIKKKIRDKIWILFLKLFFRFFFIGYAIFQSLVFFLTSFGSVRYRCHVRLISQGFIETVLRFDFQHLKNKYNIHQANYSPLHTSVFFLIFGQLPACLKMTGEKTPVGEQLYYYFRGGHWKKIDLQRPKTSSCTPLKYQYLSVLNRFFTIRKRWIWALRWFLPGFFA